jgi:hypothetical protein
MRLLARAIARAKGERHFKPYLDKMQTYVYTRGRQRGRQVKHLRAALDKGIALPYPLFALSNSQVAAEFKLLSKKVPRT